MLLYLGKCFDDESGIEEECESGLCVLSVSEYTGEEASFALCSSVGPPRLVILRLTHIIDTNMTNVIKRFHSDVFCDYDGCNTPQAGERLKKLVAEHYNVTEWIQTLTATKKPEEIEDTISSTAKSATGSNTNSTSAKK